MFRLRLLRLEERTVPALATWDGGGADVNWTTAANWVGDATPQAGDDLDFPAGASRLTSANDFPAGTAFGRLSLADGYTLSGNALTAAGVAAELPVGVTATLGLAVGGVGGLTKTGSGILVVTDDNDYAGATDVAQGVLEIRSGTALGATGVGNETMVANGATLALGGQDYAVGEAIRFAGRGADGVGAINALAQRISLTGALTMTGTARIGGSAYPALTITVGIGEVGGAYDLELFATGFVVGPSAVNTYTGTTFVGAAVEIDGTSPGPFVVLGASNSFGSLYGSGTIGPVRTEGGWIQPGQRFANGHLTTGNLVLETGAIVVAAASPPPNYIAVRGTVRLGGALTFNPPPYGNYTVIDNDGTDPVVGTFADRPEGQIIGGDSTTVWRLTYRGGDGNDVAVYEVPAASTRLSAVGAGAGGVPQVNVYDADGVLVRSFLAYDASFRGGVHVATGDVTGDGIADVITAPGDGGGPVVRVWDGGTGALVREFLAYDGAFRGGAAVATALIKGGARLADIITGAGPGGGPHVKVFDGQTGAVMGSFLAYDPAFLGGVTVAGTDWTQQFQIGSYVYNDGFIVTGAGPGGGPHVRTFTIAGVPHGGGFLAYDAAFRGGVNVAAYAPPRDVHDPGYIVTAPASGGGADVRVYDFGGTVRRAYQPYPAAFRGGIAVATPRVGPFGQLALVTGVGSGGGPEVKVWDGHILDSTVRRTYFAFDPVFPGGVFVG